MIDTSVSGNAAYLALLNLSDDRVRQAVSAAVNEALVDGQTLIVNDTPIITARLRNSIEISQMCTPDNLEDGGRISTNVEYAPAVEFGTGIYSEAPGAPKQPIEIQAKQASSIASYHISRIKGLSSHTAALGARHALKFTIGGKTFFRQKVTIKGIHPRAMFRNNVGEINRMLAEYARRNIEQMTGGS